MDTHPPLFHMHEMKTIVEEVSAVVDGHNPHAAFAALGFCLSATIRHVAETDQAEARKMVTFALDLLRKHLDKYAPPPPPPPAQ
jgi:hypothetical protein